MLQEIELDNIQDKESNFITLDGNGKILKIFVEFLTTDSSLNLTLFTKDGEEIINIQNDESKKILYPRAIIGNGKYSTDSLSNETDKIDYYYFYGGLLLYIEKIQPFKTVKPKQKTDSSFSDLKIEEKSDKIINKFVVLYDDLK